MNPQPLAQQLVEGTTLTLQTLKEMVDRMLQIYPPLARHIQDFKALIIQKFTERDITGLKETILQALEIMKNADMREITEASKLSHLRNPHAQRQLKQLLSSVYLQIRTIKMLEVTVKEFEHVPSQKLSDEINRLNAKLKELLEQERSVLEFLVERAAA